MGDSLPENPFLMVEYVPDPNVPGGGGFRWAIKGQIPTHLLVNMLELIKTTFVHQQLAMAQAAMQQQPANRLVLPNGPLPPFSP